MPVFRVRTIAICLAVALGSAGCAPAGPATMPPMGQVVCKDYGSGVLPYPIGWSGNGSWLVVRLLRSSAKVDDGVIVGWPSLESSTIYSEAGPVDILAPDNSGTMLYWWGTHDGTFGIWSLQAGRAPRLIGKVPASLRGGITWTPSGIARDTSPVNDPAMAGVNRTDWNGHDEQLLPLKQRDDTWIDTDGQWIADMEQLNPSGPETFVVYHAGTETKVTPAVRAYLLGMTPGHDAVLYRAAQDADNNVVPLVLHVLPLDGSVERTITVQVPFSDGVENLVISESGVLAFTGASVSNHQVCFVRLSLSKAS